MFTSKELFIMNGVNKMYIPRKYRMPVLPGKKYLPTPWLALRGIEL